MLSDTPSITSAYPVASGAIADIYEGTLNGLNVCVKQIRIYSTYSDEDMWRVHMVRYSFVPHDFPSQMDPKVFPGGCIVETRETS